MKIIVQLDNLTESLISKTNREKQLAEKLEDLRYTYIFIFAYASRITRTVLKK